VRAVADAGPLHYLVLIRHEGLLGQLFDGVVIPEAVRSELTDTETPERVRTWMASPPPWLSVEHDQPTDSDDLSSSFGRGERAVIALAAQIRPGLVLMDDRAAVAVARRRGFAVTGTLGLLYRAATLGLTDLRGAFEKLRTTNFHCTPALLASLLARFESGNAAP